MASSLIGYAADLLGIPNRNPQKSMQFREAFTLEKNPTNGLECDGNYIPEEIWIEIFSNLTPSDVLKCSLVCKNWHNIAKSNLLWQTIYHKLERPKKGKNLPWYVFYCYFTTENFRNLIKNGNGEENFHHWTIDCNGGDQFKIEPEPNGAPPLPVGIPEFHGHTSCFATSFELCSKYQEIDLKPKKLLRYIIEKYHPTLYASEWFTARFDCASIYKLTIGCFEDNVKNPFEERPQENFRRHRRPLASRQVSKNQGGFISGIREMEQWSNSTWEKMELKFEDYPVKTQKIFFLHEGQDRQFWKGHYGSKMAGGVVKFLFESIEPTEEDMDFNEEI